MAHYQIAVVVGSLRRDSLNLKLANAVAKLAPADFVFSQVQIGDLPLYDQDDDANQAESVKRLAEPKTMKYSEVDMTGETMLCSTVRQVRAISKR